MGVLWSFMSGGRESRKQGAFYKAYKINDALGQKLLAVGIGKSQLFDLHQIFNSMDKDNSGEINLMEFFDYIDLKRTRFSEKAFSVMDRDKSGEVDFVEFVLAVWNYCSFSRTSLVRYAFDLYDSDGSGEIELSEAAQCVREIWGGEWERNANAQKVMAKLEAVMRSSPKGRLSAQMFEEFAQTHPMLLFPAFQLQTEIQHRVLGERFWRKAARRRSLADPQALDIKAFEKLVHLSHQSSQKFLQTVDDALHDNLFEEVPPRRKRSSLPKFLQKATTRNARVFLDSNNSVTGDRDDAELSSIRQTAVTPFEAAPPTARSQKMKKQKSPATKHPPLVERTTLPLANQSQSSFVSTNPASTSSTDPPPTPIPERSPKKTIKKKIKTPTRTVAKTDLVVEDVAEVQS